MAKRKPTGKSGETSMRPAARPRPFWSGTVAFGLVSVPVDLYPAKRSRGISLRMLAPDGTPVARRYWCPKDERDVHPEHIVRGYEYAPGEHVVVRDEELEALSPRKSRQIDLRQFVDVRSIDPVFFERPYFLAPSGDSAKAYILLARAMEESGKAGVATFVMRGKEYLVAILAEKGILRAEVLRFLDELRTPQRAGLPERRTPESKDVKRLERSIRRATLDELPLAELEDRYAEAVRKLAEKKRAEEEVIVYEAPPEEEEEEERSEVDLLQAIKESMQALSRSARESRGHKAGRGTPAARPAARGGRTKDELYQRARELDIAGRSQMSKEELLRAIEEHGR